MSNYPVSRRHMHSPANMSRNGHLHRDLAVIARRSEIALTRIETEAEEAMAVAQARNAVSAAAAQADAVLSGILNALPIYDATDADFRVQLKQATRASIITDILSFDP
ncbi:MAG: hypothetical protein WCC47_24910 [Pseudonocardiaceae bacterium]